MSKYIRVGCVLLSTVALVVLSGWLSSANAQGAAKAETHTDSILDAVITKFRNDNRSFEEYVSFGKIQCYTKIINADDGDLFFQLYASLYNNLSPLARLLKEDAIKQNLDEYFLRNEARFKECRSKKEWDNKKESNIYKEIKICESLFDKNDVLKKQYLTLINNKKNYNDDSNGDFDRKREETFRKDYLDNYFIKWCRLVDPICD